MKTELPVTSIQRWLAALLFLFAPAAFGAVLTPSSGPAGTQVEVKLAGLDSAAVTSASLGAVMAPIVSRGVESVRITIPTAAVSGPVTLRLGADERVTPATFEVLRVVPVSVAAGFAGMTALGSLYGDASGGTVKVSRGRASLVFASNGADGPVLLAMVTDADGTISLSAATTARAALFLSSFIFTTDADEAAARLQTLAGLSEVSAMEAIIQTEVLAGRDYSASDAFGDQLEAALRAFLTQEVALAANRQRGARAAGVSGTVRRELMVEPKLDRIQPTTLSAARHKATGLPILQQKFGSAAVPDVDLGKFLTANPLDTAACLYALNVGDSRLNTRTKAMALGGSYSAVYNRIAPEALDRLIIASEPVSRYVAPVAMARDWLAKQSTGFPPPVFGARALHDAPVLAVKTALDIPDDAPGLYMVRTFNGARFDRQYGLLDSLPGGRHEHHKMLALNIILAANDALAFFITDVVVSDVDWAKNLMKLEKNVANAIERQAFQGTLDADAIKAIVLATIKTVHEVVLDKARKAGIASLPSGLGTLVTTVLKRMDQVAAAAKLFERVNAMTNGVQVFSDNVYTIQSVEDTLFIVGDPWAPRLSGFHPQRGRRGSRVTISGSGFSSVASENIVTFGYAGTTPDAPDAAARATIFESFSNTLLVLVPPDANTGVITVHVTNKGTTSTAGLSAPFQQFTVTPDAVLTAVDPPQATPGQKLRLTGLNFPPLETDELYAKLYAVFTLEGETLQVPLSGTSTELIVTAPFSTGTGTVFLRYGEFFGGVLRDSNALSFTVIPSVTPQTGAEIRFEPNPDSVGTPNSVGHDKDDRLTLREALMLKNGTLDYAALSTPPVPRPPGTVYETDYVSSNVIGTGVRNRIVGYFAGGTHTLSLTSSLPPVASLTTLEVRRVSDIGPPPRFEIDGNGAATGIVLDNAHGVSVFGLHLRNFSNAAFLLTGGSRDNDIRFCTVEGGEGHGVHFLESASRNRVSVPVDGANGDGYRLSGPNVTGNDITVTARPDALSLGTITFCDGWGIRIENGAHLNRILAPEDAIFTPPPSGGINYNGSGGILVTGDNSTGNTIHQMYSEGLPIEVNGGPGIRIESPHTTVYLCRILNNFGTGIEIAGPAAAGSRVGACTIGYHWVTGAAAPNEGHGIHIRNTHDIRIGEDLADPLLDVPMNGIASNSEHGILIEQSHAIIVQSTQLGRVPLENAAAPQVDLPNDGSGIEVRDTRDSTFGSNWFRARLQITGHQNGAGIAFAGPQCSNNTVTGAYIGYDPANPNTGLGNATGIEVVEAAWGMRIGTGGGGGNFIYYNRLYGVLIDAGSDPTQTITVGGEPIEPRGGTVIVNNRIQQNQDSGVILTSNAKATRIGGPGFEANTINSNGKFGIEITGASAVHPAFGNRVLSNTIFGNGIDQAAFNPLVGFPKGAGVLIHDSTGQRVGGHRVAEGNNIGNSWAGVIVMGGSDNFVTHNRMSNCRTAGLILRETKWNEAGPNNEITDCGVVGFGPLGGIVLSDTTDNYVHSNRIGSLRNGAPRSIIGDGVLLLDSSNNAIGGHGTDGNIINNASLYGVRLTGANSFSNYISGNWIGMNPGPGAGVQPNAGGGVVLEAGANFNTIGGLLPVVVNGAVAQLPAGNFIRHNGGEGVRVAGAATFSNAITDNSITANGGVGIFLAASGNRNLAEPVLIAEPTRITGTSVAPNGSVVQFFQDTGGEGGTPLGIEAIVQAGAFQIALPALLSADQVTATVTSAGKSDTSQFAIPVTIPPPPPIGLRISRPGGAPVARSAAPGTTILVLPLRCEVLGEVAARIMGLKLDFTGTAASAVAEAALYRDANRNGVIDFGDTRVGPILTTFGAGAEFTGSLTAVQPGAPSQLLLALKLAAGATNGQEVEFRLSAAAGVTAIVLFGPAPVSVTGTFPAVSDRITVNQSAPLNNFTAWAGSYFTLDELPAIGAPNSDAEGDSLPNLLEYFTGTHPRQNNASPLQIPAAGGGDTLTFTHLNRPDVTWAVEEAPDLDQWGALNFGTLLAPQTLGDGSIRETISFTRNGSALFFRIHATLTGP